MRSEQEIAQIVIENINLISNGLLNFNKERAVASGLETELAEEIANDINFFNSDRHYDCT